MNHFELGVLVLLGFTVTACGGDDADNQGGSAGQASGGGGGSGNGSSGNGSSGSSTTSGGAPPATPPGSKPSPMPVISRDVPTFASSTDAASSTGAAQDGKPNTSWLSSAVPAWLAYDLSTVPEVERQRVVVAWYDGAALDFINEAPDAGKHLPIDYALEINTAAGGGEPPEAGWQTVEAVTGNDRNSRQRLMDLDGASWVRMSVSKSSNATVVGFDLDVHSAPDGATDSWLFMGDSITFMSTSYLFSDLPQQVNDLTPERWPAVIPAAVGGTNTMTAVTALDATAENFPGRFVVLAYGTNDHPGEYQMEQLVQDVIAMGKVPVVPHMPWSTDARIQEEGPLINEMIDGLYEKYPEILRGPDFWTLFVDRTDLIPTGDVHPNDEGQRLIRKQWAMAMTP